MFIRFAIQYQFFYSDFFGCLLTLERYFNHRDFISEMHGINFSTSPPKLQNLFNHKKFIKLMARRESGSQTSNRGGRNSSSNSSRGGYGQQYEEDEYDTEDEYDEDEYDDDYEDEYDEDDDFESEYD